MPNAYRPRACSHAEVLQRLEQGARARSVPSGVRVLARDTEPPVVAQPGEVPLELAGGPLEVPSARRELWLWSDGTLRQAPEAVVVGCPLDRFWKVG